MNFIRDAWRAEGSLVAGLAAHRAGLVTFWSMCWALLMGIWAVLVASVVMFSSWLLYHGLILKRVRVGFLHASQVYCGSRSGHCDTIWDAGLPVFLATRVNIFTAIFMYPTGC